MGLNALKESTYQETIDRKTLNSPHQEATQDSEYLNSSANPKPSFLLLLKQRIRSPWHNLSGVWGVIKLLDEEQPSRW